MTDLAPSTPAMTVEQLATHLGMSVAWVYEAVAAKRIPHHRLGRATRFTAADVKRIEAQSQVEPMQVRRLRSVSGGAR